MSAIVSDATGKSAAFGLVALDRVEGLVKSHSRDRRSKGAIYIGEVNGTNVRKLVRKE